MQPGKEPQRDVGRATIPVRVGVLAAWLALPALQASASMFDGETLDAVAEVLTWVVIVVAPIVGIGAFLMIHILPEKIAEKKKHPQVKAIQCLCLLSLVFGGLLWPLAWLWAYTKPVMHKLAYGTDVGEHENHGPEPSKLAEAQAEAEKLRARIAQLEGKLANVAASLGGEA